MGTLGALRAASQGEGSERYTLQIPFVLGAGYELALEERALRCLRDDNELSVEVLENRGLLLLRVQGFRRSEEARDFLPKAHGALLQLTVSKRLPLRVSDGLQQPRLFGSPVDLGGDPTPLKEAVAEITGWSGVDGHVDPSAAVVIPEHLRLVGIKAGAARVTRTLAGDTFLDAVEDGLRLAAPEQIAGDERLALAIDLFAASFSEGPKARLITLVTALESLLEPSSVRDEVQRWIDGLLSVLDRDQGDLTGDPALKAEHDRLRSRLAGLKRESISRGLNELVVAEADSLEESEEALVRRVAGAYGTRSKLVHEGHADTVDIQVYVSWLAEMVPRILEARIERLHGPTR